MWEQLQMFGKLVMPSMLLFLLVVGVLGILLGLALVSRTQLVWRIGDTLNRWVSFRRWIKPLEEPHDSWHLVERNRRVVALVMIVAALYTISMLLRYDFARLADRMAASTSIRPIVMAWMLSAFQVFVLLGNVVAVIVSIMLALRPDMLARLDHAASRWISTRHLVGSGDTMHSNFDRLVAAWPRTAGVLIAVFSVVEVVCVARAMPWY